MEHPQTPPWEREDLSPRQCAVRTIEYHRSQGRDDPEFLKDEVIRVLSQHLARTYAASCRRQLERAGGDVEVLLRRPAELTRLDRTIDETLNELRTHILGLFRKYGLEIPESFLQSWPTNVFFDWHEELRSDRFPEVWKAWGFREPTGKKREKALSDFGLACDYAKWTLMHAVEARRSLDVTWNPWTGPLGYGQMVNTLSETLALLAQIRPEHTIAGLKSHRAGEHGAASGVQGGRPPDSVKAAFIEALQNLVDEGMTAEQLFWQFDEKVLFVKEERCPVRCDHDHQQLIVECAADDVRVRLETFRGYVTRARALHGRSQ